VKYHLENNRCTSDVFLKITRRGHLQPETFKLCGTLPDHFPVFDIIPAAFESTGFFYPTLTMLIAQTKVIIFSFFKVEGYAIIFE
jgi:hypothetical protein